MVLIACEVLKDELERALRELGRECEVVYFDSMLHLDDSRMYEALTERLEQACGTSEQVGLLLGTGCHPEIREIAARYGAKMPDKRNCLELLIGDKMRELNDERESYFLSRGWMKNWREAMTYGHHRDETDARINFGYFDRTVFIDTGTGSVPDEEFFDFFEFTQTPIEPYETDLEHFKAQLSELLDTV